MLYINSKVIKDLGVNWEQTIEVIEQAVIILNEGDISQPIKPYLRFHDLNNRIIAMPAFVGGEILKAGIKWIASFPQNIQRGIQRAHSVTILNDPTTGIPVAFLNTALISGIRTASVSGLLIKYYEKERLLKNIKVGIVGFGPIGQLHLQMLTEVFGSRIGKVFLYDIKEIRTESIPDKIKHRTVITNSWEDAYCDSDIFITCTASSVRYIDKKPKANSLLLNISLRDFKPEILDYTRSIIVDDWEEVCRENTDIELMHESRGLQKVDTKSLTDIVCNDQMKVLSINEPIMFNPMGMAIFDIAISNFYYQTALANRVGTYLQD
jgi:2,3-diaminopropionate biosynthesis protein SbnB